MFSDALRWKRMHMIIGGDLQNQKTEYLGSIEQTSQKEL